MTEPQPLQPDAESLRLLGKRDQIEARMAELRTNLTSSQRAQRHAARRILAAELVDAYKVISWQFRDVPPETAPPPAEMLRAATAVMLKACETTPSYFAEGS